MLHNTSGLEPFGLLKPLSRSLALLVSLNPNIGLKNAFAHAGFLRVSFP